MTRTLREISSVQNPALGAALVWRFCAGYCPEGAATAGAPLPLCFVVLPITLHAETCSRVLSTQAVSGLRTLETKFTDESDYLLAIQTRALAMRELTIRSIAIAVAAKLVTLVPSDATVWPTAIPKPPESSASVRKLLGAAERLGGWCRGLSVYEIAGILRVEF